MITELKEWDWLFKSLVAFVSAFASVEVSTFMVDGLTAILLVFDIHILNQIEELVKWFAAIMMSIVGVAIIFYQFRIKIKELKIKDKDLRIKEIELQEREIAVTDLQRYSDKLRDEVDEATQENIKTIQKRVKLHARTGKQNP